MTETQATVSPQVSGSNELIAEPDAAYRWKHLIMAILLIAGGLWFAYDGWIKWPAQNAQIEQLQKDKAAAQESGDGAKVEAAAKQLGSMSHHTEADILIQKALAFTLPVFGLFWGIWTLRDTRGLYRMSGDTLHVPGHPPITYSAIRRIDKRKWDRKGIAFLHYEHGNPPAPRVLKLDDFAYERKATDAILERIEKNLLSSVMTDAGARADA